MLKEERMRLGSGSASILQGGKTGELGLHTVLMILHTHSPLTLHAHFIQRERERVVVSHPPIRNYPKPHFSVCFVSLGASSDRYLLVHVIFTGFIV